MNLNTHPKRLKKHWILIITFSEEEKKIIMSFFPQGISVTILFIINRSKVCHETMAGNHGYTQIRESIPPEPLKIIRYIA